MSKVWKDKIRVNAYKVDQANQVTGLIDIQFEEIRLLMVATANVLTLIFY